MDRNVAPAPAPKPRPAGWEWPEMAEALAMLVVVLVMIARLVGMMVRSADPRPRVEKALDALDDAGRRAATPPQGGRADG